MRNVSRILPLLPGIAMLSGCNNAAQKSNGQNDQKPNIIYIFADDLGIGDLRLLRSNQSEHTQY